MNYQIVETTDGKYLGAVVSIQNETVTLPDEVVIEIDKTLPLADGLRLISSNYIIDLVEVQNG